MNNEFYMISFCQTRTLLESFLPEQSVIEQRLAHNEMLAVKQQVFRVALTQLGYSNQLGE